MAQQPVKTQDLPIVRWQQPNDRDLKAWEQGKDPEDPATYHPWAGLPNCNPAQRAAVGKVIWMRTPANFEILVWVADLANVDELRYFCHGYGLGTYDPFARRGYTVMSTHMHLVLKDPDLVQQVVVDSKVVDMDSAIVASNDKVGKLTDAQIFGKAFGLLDKPVDVSTDPSIAPYWNIRQGDVVAWWAKTSQTPDIKRWPLAPGAYWPTPLTTCCLHTAVIEQPVFEPKKVGNQVKWYLSKKTVMSSKNGPQPLKHETTLGAVMDVYKECPGIGVYRLLPIPQAPSNPWPSAEALEAARQAILEYGPELDAITEGGPVIPSEREL